MNSTDDDPTPVTHEDLLDRLISHESRLAGLVDAIEAINFKLDPIVQAVRSIAFAFKGLLILGAGAAAVAGILELVDRLNN
jgi:hypothetical protein